MVWRVLDKEHLINHSQKPHPFPKPQLDDVLCPRKQ